jgi:ribosomal protein S27AE
MRAKCPKCGSVFEVKPGFTLVHAGPYRRIKCPACGKKSIMNNLVNDPIT